MATQLLWFDWIQTPGETLLYWLNPKPSLPPQQHPRNKSLQKSNQSARGGQISTRSVQKVLRRNQTNWSSDSSVISADSEPAARLHWADWSSLAAAVCVMIPPEICSAPSPLHLTATLHLLSAARTTSWHTLVTLKLWNIQMCWNITFNRHFESYFTGKQTPEEATIKKQKQRHFDRLGYLITSLFFTCREICPCWTPYTVRLRANHIKAEAASEKGSWLAALIQEMNTELDVTEKSPQWKGEVAF